MYGNIILQVLASNDNDDKWQGLGPRYEKLIF